ASATPTLTSVTVAWTAPSSDGGAAITAYDLQYKESSATSWTQVDDIWETGGGTLSYRKTGLTPSTGYDFQVRAVNADGDGAWSATQTATTGTPAISGTAALSYAENSAVRVGTFTVTGAVEGVDEVTWAISGTDASHFDISTPKGALRLIDTSDTATGLKRPKMPDHESPDDDGADGSYSITLTATVGGVDATLAVTVALTDVDEPGVISLSPARPKVGTALTATLGDPDTVSGTPTWVWQRSSGRNSWATIAGATSASYTPVAADSGQYLRVTATYTDGHGANKTAEATAHHVVIANVLTGLSATTTDSALALTPAFAADVLHYKVSCGDTDTMTVTPTAATGVRLAVDGTQTASGTAVDLSVTKHSDVVVRASGADGGFTDYVVHCVQDWLATMEAIDRGAGDVTESLIAFPLGVYLAIIDHHGVPRFRRQPGDTPRFWFRHYRVGASGEYRWHYTTRPPGECATHHILDEDFTLLAAVHSFLPLQCTGLHDFRILDNGGYLLMSYEPRVSRDLSHITLHPSLLAGGENAGRVRHRPDDGNLESDWRTTQFSAAEGLSDSAVQLLTSSRSVSRSWRSWGAMAYEDCVQHWWDEYAHLNSVQYFEGSVIGSFRGCSKVLSINASTGKVDWRLGRSNLTAEEWAERNIGPAPLRIVGDPEGEFCGQHAAEMRPDGQDGRLTLFDNNEDCLLDLATGETERTSDEYARAVEYALDLANGEAVFVRDHSLHGTKDRAGTRGGQVEVLDNGDWLIGWGRERQTALQSTKLSPDEAITRVDPSTGTEKLSFKIPSRPGSEFQANVRPSAVPAYVLAPQPVTLSAAAPASERTAVFHRGDDDTPQVLVTFNRPIVDFAITSPSLSVTGGTVTAVSALVADGEPANAYLFTLDPAGEGAVTLRLLANKSCAAGGICAADGTTLKQALSVVVSPAPLVAFHRAAYSIGEGASGSVVVRLTRAHQSASGVTIPIVLDATASSASQADFTPDFATAQSVTFQRGETSKTFRIQAATDALVEAGETIVLGFGTLPDAIGTGTISSTTVTLINATNPVITFSRLEGELAEGDSATFTIAITNDVTFAADATINLTVGGSATAGDDFTLEDASGSALSAPYSVTLPAGASSTSFTIRATDDSVAEPTDETVTISATVALTSASLGSRTVTIPPSDVANVPDVTISADGDVAEGSEAAFSLERTGATTASLTVSVRVVATDVSLSAAAPTSVTFDAGSASAALSLPTRDDTVVRDGGGQVTAYLLGSSSNPPTYLTTPENRATVAVTENDAPDFSVTASAEDLTEGQSLVLTVDTGGVTFPDAQTIELRLAGSATAGDDYLLPGGCTGSSCLLTLQRGARAARATFRTRYDGVSESDESIAIDAYHDGAFIGSVAVNLLNAAARRRVVSGGGGGGFGPAPGEVSLTVTAAVVGEDAPAGHRFGFALRCTPPGAGAEIAQRFTLAAGQGFGRFVPGAAPCTLTVTDDGGADRVDGPFTDLVPKEDRRIVVTFTYGLVTTLVALDTETVVEDGGVALRIPAGSRAAPYAVVLETGAEHCEDGLAFAGELILCYTVSVFDADEEEETDATLLVPATVTITLDAATVEELGGLAGVRAARERGELRMLRRDDGDSPWRELPFTVEDTKAGAVQIVLSISAFSDFALISAEPRLRTISLHAGWNVVRWDGADGAAIADALADIADQVGVVYQWVAETQTWRSHRPGAPPILSSFDRFTRGATYWVRAAAATEWTVVGGPIEPPAAEALRLHPRWTEVV
ncbi:MAG: aryl-sulfate sulfotransferase, partial [Chloroflexota bacterium]|nr:aryl-sulfate sulfotransferase [Chloroflexota bacterium]